MSVDSISFVAGALPNIGALKTKRPPPTKSQTGDPIKMCDKAALRTRVVIAIDLFVVFLSYCAGEVFVSTN